VDSVDLEGSEERESARQIEAGTGIGGIVLVYVGVYIDFPRKGVFSRRPSHIFRARVVYSQLTCRRFLQETSKEVEEE
jgi:hypothetical protein